VPTYTITDPQTGKTVKLTGDSPPTPEELEQIFSKVAEGSQPYYGEPHPQPSAPAGSGGVMGTLRHAAGYFPGLTGVGIQTAQLDREQATGTPHPPNPQGAENIKQALTWGGNVIAGMTGMGSAGRDAVENPKTTLATAALPLAGKAARAAIPSKARAGANFEQVMGAAQDIPIDTAKVGNAALRIYQLSERGGTMPKVVRDFVKRATDPAKGDITYKEARDFYHNISRLSADEYNRLSPVMKSHINKLRGALNESLEGAAKQGGKLPEYRGAMREYRQASQLSDFADKTWETTRDKALPYGAAYYALQKLSELVRGGRE
jgi:hypothetical protein